MNYWKVYLLFQSKYFTYIIYMQNHMTQFTLSSLMFVFIYHALKRKYVHLLSKCGFQGL